MIRVGAERASQIAEGADRRLPRERDRAVGVAGQYDVQEETLICEQKCAEELRRTELAEDMPAWTHVVGLGNRN